MKRSGRGGEKGLTLQEANSFKAEELNKGYGIPLMKI